MEDERRRMEGSGRRVARGKSGSKLQVVAVVDVTMS